MRATAVTVLALAAVLLLAGVRASWIDVEENALDAEAEANSGHAAEELAEDSADGSGDATLSAADAGEAAATEAAEQSSHASGGGLDAGAVAVQDAEGAIELGDSAVLDSAGVKIIEEFDAVIGGESPALVFFYLPSCGYCAAFQPVYERVARRFRRNRSDVVIAKVDSARWGKCSDRYGVDSVPDVRYFAAKSTDAVAYKGRRTASALTDFLNEYLGTSVHMGFRQIALDAKLGALDAEPLTGSCPRHERDPFEHIVAMG